MRSSYRAKDVTLLLKDIEEQDSETRHERDQQPVLYIPYVSRPTSSP